MIKRFTAPLLYSKTWSDINILTLFCLFTVRAQQIFHTGALFTLYRQVIKMYTIYIYVSSVWIIYIFFSIHCSPYQSKTKTNKQTWIFYMSIFHFCAVTGRVIQNVKGKKQNFIYLFYSPSRKGKSVKLSYYRHHRSGNWQWIKSLNLIGFTHNKANHGYCFQ